MSTLVAWFQKWMPMVNWMNLDYLTWGLLIPLLMIVLWFGYMNSKRRLSVLQVSTGGIERWNLKPSRVVLKGGLILLAFLLIIIALAGPRIGWVWQENRQKGLDIAIAVDVSKSMLAKDLDPSRLEQARRMILDLLDVSYGDRLGLIVFAGTAFVQCPMTVDHGAFKSFLEGLTPDMIPVGGTDIAGALHESLRALKVGGEDQGLGKMIVLLTDGEDRNGGLEKEIKAIADAKVKVITVGMASLEGSPIADQNGALVKDKHGNVVVSRLDESTLKQIAEKTDGQYFRATDANVSIAKIYQDVIRSKGAVREGRAKRMKLWYERFQWPAALALFLLILDLLLLDVKAGTLMALVCFAMTPDDLLAASPNFMDVYNHAIQAFDSGDLATAKQEFEQCSQSSEKSVQIRCHYNLANMLGVEGKFDDAVKHYESVLAMDSQDQQARDNLAWARRKSNSKKDQENKDKDKNKKSDDAKKNEPAPSKDGDKGDQKSKSDSKDDSKNNEKGEDSQVRKEDPKNVDEKQKESKNDEKKLAEPKGEMTESEAERLLRSAPDERKYAKPLNNKKGLKPTDVDQDW